MMAVVIQHSFSSTCRLQGSVDSLGVAIGITQTVVVAFALPDTTAYAIHAYDFKLKKYIYPFILMIMMIPTQVTALGFIKLVSNMKLEDSFIPLIVPL